MKRILTQWIVLLCVLGCATTTVFAAAEKEMSAKGKEISVTGEMSCTFCKLSNPAKACEKGCCDRCVQAGDPVLLTAADGNQYILLTGEKQVPLMTSERQAMMGGKVAVKGVLVKGKGVQAIYVETMEKK